jgi:hypothetical protein
MSLYVVDMQEYVVLAIVTVVPSLFALIVRTVSISFANTMTMCPTAGISDMTVLDIELSTRHLRRVSKKSLKEEAAGCVNMYDEALEKFPESATIRVLRGLLYTGYLNDPLMAHVEMQKALQLDPTLEERYLTFCLDLDYAEQRMNDAHGGQIDFISFPEFAKNFKTVQKSYRTTVRVIHAFWRILLNEDVDLNVLPAFIRKMQKLESECDALFVKLLSANSKSQVCAYVYILC